MSTNVRLLDNAVFKEYNGIITKTKEKVDSKKKKTKGPKKK